MVKSFKLCKDVGCLGLFELMVVDMGVIGFGQVLMVYEVVCMLCEGVEVCDVVYVIENCLCDVLYVYFVFDELLYMYICVKQKGEKSIIWGCYMMGMVFNVCLFIYMYWGEMEVIVKVCGFDEGICCLMVYIEIMIVEECLVMLVVVIMYFGLFDIVCCMELV